MSQPVFPPFCVAPALRHERRFWPSRRARAAKHYGKRGLHRRSSNGAVYDGANDGEPRRASGNTVPSELLNGFAAPGERIQLLAKLFRHPREQFLRQFGSTLARIFRNLFQRTIYPRSAKLTADKCGRQTAAHLPVWMIGYETFVSWSELRSAPRRCFCRITDRKSRRPHWVNAVNEKFTDRHLTIRSG